MGRRTQLKRRQTAATGTPEPTPEPEVEATTWATTYRD